MTNLQAIIMPRRHRFITYIGYSEQPMTTIETTEKKAPDLIRERIFLLPLTSAIIITVFLFCVDEGYNDFRWAREIKNWAIFSLFVLGFFTGQAIIAAYCFRNVSGWVKKVLVLCLGLPLGVLFIVFLMYLATLGYAFSESLS